MSPNPEQPAGAPPTVPPAAVPPAFLPPPRTSAMAIASAILGSLGTVTCCIILPSVLAVVFGLVALSPIKRGEVAGRGLAIAGLVLGCVGLLFGVGFWIVAAVSPANEVVSGAKLSASDRGKLEAMNVIAPGEPVDLFYPDGMFSIREGGVVITDRRLVVYASSGTTSSCRLSDVTDISITPARNWMGDSTFVVTTRDRQVITFTISNTDSGDTLFEEVLRRKTGIPADSARRRSEMRAESDDSNPP